MRSTPAAASAPAPDPSSADTTAAEAPSGGTTPGSAGSGAGPFDDPRVVAFLDTFSSFMDAVNQRSQHQKHAGSGPSVADVLREHLDADARGLAVVTETVPALRAVDADVALEVVVARHGGGHLVGVGGGEQRMHTSFSEIVEQSALWQQFPVAAVDYARAATGPDTERRTVAFGLHLFRYAGSPVAVLQRAGSPRHGNEAALEVLCVDESAALDLLAELRTAMIDHSVLRGQVVTFTVSDFGPGAGADGMTFVRREPVPASDVVLPEGTLSRIERQVVGVARHRDALRSAGQHLKRGVLLYGPPGTGKTHTVRHLVGASPGTTVLLLAGSALRMVRLATETARGTSTLIGTTSRTSSSSGSTSANALAASLGAPGLAGEDFFVFGLDLGIGFSFAM